MNIRYLIVSLVFLSISFLLVGVPHAYIKGWEQGSYGNYPGISHGRPPLPIYVRIDLDEPVAQDFADKFVTFMHQLINQSSRNQTAKKHILGGYCFRVNPSITREYLESLIDKANHHFVVLLFYKDQHHQKVLRLYAWF